MIDGEIVAFDQDGRPSFNALHNFGSASTPVVYYVFDVLVLGPRVHENEGAIGIRYYILSADEPVEPLAFEVRDQQGTVLGRYALSYRLVPSSYLCSFEGP